MREAVIAAKEGWIQIYQIEVKIKERGYLTIAKNSRGLGIPDHTLHSDRCCVGKATFGREGTSISKSRKAMGVPPT